MFKKASARRRVYQCERETLTWGETVRYPSVCLSPTLSINEKVEQRIRKKIHKPIALRFWIEGGVDSLCGSSSYLIVVWIFPMFFPPDFINKWYGSDK